MSSLEICFWACAAGVAYAYAGYPLLLLVMATLRPRPVHRGTYGGSVSIVMSAFNEERRIRSRRDELTSLAQSCGPSAELIIVSDGSTDGTAAAARIAAAPCVRVIELPQNVGKAEALNRGCADANGDVIVFADVRQRWAVDALALLLENFSDRSIGAASGDLCLEDTGGVAGGVGLYWRYEKAIRKLEYKVHSPPGATGAISAVRRNLFRPIPTRIILDDVYWPLQVVMQGFRVVHDDRAMAYDRLPDRAADEFRRKVRTLSGNLQLVAKVPALLLPWRNPIWFQFVSHKLMRLVVPWMLIGMLVACALLSSRLYRIALIAQLGVYLLAVLGLREDLGRRFKPASVAGSFLLLNAAAWMAFWVWISGRAGSSWGKARYEQGPTAARPEALGPTQSPSAVA